MSETLIVVLVADLLVYVTAVFVFVHSCLSNAKATTKVFCLLNSNDNKLCTRLIG